jgi:hypothetical protein
MSDRGGKAAWLTGGFLRGAAETLHSVDEADRDGLMRAAIAALPRVAQAV